VLILGVIIGLGELEPPASSYPSGHTVATSCLYVAIAVLAISLAPLRRPQYSPPPGVRTQRRLPDPELDQAPERRRAKHG
jgi:membrane-associated phospholipid phosphatase